MLLVNDPWGDGVAVSSDFRSESIGAPAHRLVEEKGQSSRSRRYARALGDSTESQAVNSALMAGTVADKSVKVSMRLAPANQHRAPKSVCSEEVW